MWYNLCIEVSWDAGQRCNSSNTRFVISKLELELLLEKHFKWCVLREWEGDKCVYSRRDESEENENGEVAVKLRAEGCEWEND